MRIGTAGFVAARLTEAREARGLAKTALSEITGIKSQSISHYEQGRQSPSPEALSLLCAKLEMPERFFLRPGSTESAVPACFRSLRPQARAARLGAERRLGWLAEISDYVRRFVNLPALRVPEIEVSPELSNWPPLAEHAAEECRQFLQLGSGPLSDICGLLENAGCVVARMNLDGELGGSLSGWSGGLPYAFFTSTCGQSRLRLNAAYELGHMVMHRRATRERLADPDLYRILILQADRFARALLLPAKTFGAEVWAPTIDALLSLKRAWNCPIAAMIRRCGEIGRFDPDQVRRGFINLGRRGWRTCEPLEDATPPAAPGLLAQSIRAVLDDVVRDRHSFLTGLALAAADVEELAGLPGGFLTELQIPPAAQNRLGSMRQTL